MTCSVSLGLIGLLTVVLVVSGEPVGRALFGGLGSVAGLVLGVVVSGRVLRTYFARREAVARQEE